MSSISSTPSLQFLNLMGILNCRRSGNRIVLAKHNLIFNCLKLCGLIFFYKEIVDFYVDHTTKSYFTVLWTPFSAMFLDFYSHWPFLQAKFTIFVFALTSQSNIRLLNNIRNLQVQSSRKSPHFKVVFENYEIAQKKYIVSLLSVTSIFYLLDYLATTRHSFWAFVAYMVFSFSYFVNLSLLCYISTIFQFFVYAQKAINSNAENASSDDLKAVIEDISTIHSSLYKIKENFVSTLQLPILTMIFYFFSIIVCQVRKFLFCDEFYSNPSNC